MERYSRNIMLPQIGPEGQQRLLGSSVLVVGAGGLGSAALPYLVGAGVGHIGIADYDTVSLSNLQRQVLYTEDELDTPKTLAASRRLAAQNSSLRFSLFPEGFTPSNAREVAAPFDLLLDCTDNFAVRFLIDDTCADLGKPWVHGAIGEFHGQLTVFGHTLGRRYAELYPDRGALCSLPRRTLGVLGAVPGVIGAMQASEAIKLLAGFGTLLEGKLFTLDFLTMEARTLIF